MADPGFSIRKGWGVGSLCQPLSLGQKTLTIYLPKTTIKLKKLDQGGGDLTFPSYFCHVIHLGST